MKNAQFTSRQLPLAGAALLCVLLAGCAAPNPRGLVHGQSTAQDVQAQMGQPAQKIDGPAGATWFYPTGPAGYQTYAVHLDKAGVVENVEQTLTVANLAKLRAGQSTEQDVLATLGPPGKVLHFPRNGTQAWDYRMIDVDPETVTAQFSPDGRLIGTVVMPDNYLDWGTDGCRC